jgi:hypothetical protein
MVDFHKLVCGFLRLVHPLLSREFLSVRDNFLLELVCHESLLQLKGL